MVDGGVSIAARSVYPVTQARLLLSEVSREAEKWAGKKSSPQHNGVGHESQSDR